MDASSIDPSFLVPDNRYGLRHLLVPLAGYALVLAFASMASGPILVLVACVAGLLQYRLYFPLHEASHFHLFISRAANRGMGRLLAALLFTSFTAFRREHVLHHGAIGTEKDPGGSDYHVKLNSRRQLVGFLLLPLVGGTLLGKIRSALHYRQTSEKSDRLLEPALLLLVQLSLFVAVGKFGRELWRYPVLVMLPFVTLFLFLSRLRMFLEHAPLAGGEDAPVMSRTVAMAGLDAWLLSGCNFRYHCEHHCYPQIPGVHLPKVSAILRETRAAEETSYTALLRDYWRRLG